MQTGRGVHFATTSPTLGRMLCEHRAASSFRTIALTAPHQLAHIPGVVVVRAVILGSDMLLAARPAAPMQVLHACLRHEFDFAAPVSWGEELLASRAGAWLSRHPDPALIMVHCPFVAEALRTIPSTGATCLAGVAPPVATARYIRHLFSPRTVHVVYAGACPGATGPEIDEVLLPELLLAQLADARIALTEEPHELDSRLPPVRARYASLPGGVPEPEWLWRTTSVAHREVAPLTLAVAPLLAGGERVLLDLNAACGCACARDRFAVSRLEPPRAALPVLDQEPVIDLRDGAPLGVPEAGRLPWKVVELEDEAAPVVVRQPAAAAAAGTVAEGAADMGGTTAVPGSDPGAAPERAPASDPSRVTPDRLTAVVEPWLEPPRGPAAHLRPWPGRAIDATTAGPDPAPEPSVRTNGAPPGHDRAGNERPARAVDPDIGMHP